MNITAAMTTGDRFFCFLNRELFYFPILVGENTDGLGRSIRIKFAFGTIDTKVSAPFVEGIYSKVCGYAFCKFHGNNLVVHHIVIGMVNTKTIIGTL